MRLSEGCKSGGDLPFRVHVLVQFLNIYSLYCEHPLWLAELLKRTQSNETAVGYSVVSIVCFWFIAKSLWSPTVAASERARAN